MEFERVDRHIKKIKRQGTQLEYGSICAPNYLHDAHVRMAFKIGADAICEKPLVLNPLECSCFKGYRINLNIPF